MVDQKGRGKYRRDDVYREKMSQSLKKTYSKYGYQTLVIWERELSAPDDVLKRIEDFEGG